DEVTTVAMSAYSLLRRHRLSLKLQRPLSPLFSAGLTNHLELLFTRCVRKVSTDNALTNVGCPSSKKNGALIDNEGDIVHRDAIAGQAGIVSNSERQRTHQFDTYRFVSALQSAGYSRPQAVALMKCLRTVL